ncbi:pentatricopeptide repeat-containing protein At1g14470 [Impatiens glandulifera]|uniref:pentatricopeptide repeat-containing protein At1g14470 n=1 Tax=Impatiens glandulifera TaxID=253017 RepID=UPI001FB04B6F|nr:pentatricopeptide repeat-containing protein At1g14470 [Impatiens glandulifera]XP_047323487.1 pentatricopeptide repeat-containing protein At1g14470 [Impatiens glandulifera]
MSICQTELRIIANKVSSFNHLKQLHSQIIINHLFHHNQWSALLLNLCTRLHSPPAYARAVFNSVQNPDVAVFTNIFRFYYRTVGCRDDLVALFGRTHSNGVHLDVSLYPILIKSTGRAAVGFHGYLVKLGYCCNKYVRNAVMGMYGNYGPIEDARRMFDEMSERAVVDWNLMISGYWDWGNENEACRIFELAPVKDVITWTTMVTGFSKINDIKNARIYFDQMPEKNIVSWNAMLSGYAQNGFGEEAICLFNELMNSGLEPNETTWVSVISACSIVGDPILSDSVVKMLGQKNPKPNFYVKTALLDMYAKRGSLETARKIFDELGSHRSPVTWNAMISAYSRLGELVLAKELFDRMPKKDSITWNSLIAGYAQNAQPSMAIDIFKKMISSDSTPDEITIVSVLSACGQMGAIEFGNWVVANILRKNQISLTLSGYTSLIFMYSKCGNMKDAQDVFDKMPIRSVISYNALITGLAAHGNGYKALELLTNMKGEGIEPDRITYIGILTACSHSGLLDEGRKIFKMIIDKHVEHYACMVDLLGRMGKLDEAKTLIEQMPIEPNEGVYGSLLNASRMHKRSDLGELAAEKLFELDPEDSGNYVLLSNIFASQGRWDDVERIRNRMREKGLEKTTGRSWVEHDGKMHRFIIGDRSHERCVEIYRLLAEIQKKMRAFGYVSDKSCVLRDVEEEDKEEMVGTHSEKIAIAFALLVSEKGSVIRVMKNLRICWDCHMAVKIISKLEDREIIVRDNNRFHCFNGGLCSCNDYW